jgi:hypothetical protein
MDGMIQGAVDEKRRELPEYRLKQPKRYWALPVKAIKLDVSTDKFVLTFDNPIYHPIQVSPEWVKHHFLPGCGPCVYLVDDAGGSSLLPQANFDTKFEPVQ